MQDSTEKKYAPICLFVYKRLEHLQSVIDSLKMCKETNESELIVFSDGPRKTDIEEVAMVRQYLNTLTGFKKITIFESRVNQGLASSIINGVTRVLEMHHAVIVLEDDIVVSPLFLKYMNDALEFYEHSEEVISVHGYSVPIKTNEKNYFLKGADCWGWATWSSKWSFFEADGSVLLDKLKNRKDLCDFEFNYTYPFLDMLKGQIKGRNNSWAIRWYASAFLLNKYTVYPAESLVRNIGLDGSGQHCEAQEIQDQTISENLKVLDFSDIVQENKIIRKRIEEYYLSKRKLKGKILCRVKQLLSFI